MEFGKVPLHVTAVVLHKCSRIVCLRREAKDSFRVRRLVRLKPEKRAKLAKKPPAQRRVWLGLHAKERTNLVGIDKPVELMRKKLNVFCKNLNRPTAEEHR